VHDELPHLLRDLDVHLPVDLPAKMDAVRSLGRSTQPTRDTLELLEEAHGVLGVALLRVRTARERLARDLHRGL